jgi:hypothetical protein
MSRDACYLTALGDMLWSVAHDGEEQMPCELLDGDLDKCAFWTDHKKHQHCVLLCTSQASYVWVAGVLITDATDCL